MGVSSRGMYMRNIAGITPKWKAIRIADIIQYQMGVIYAVMRIYRSYMKCQSPHANLGR